MMLTASPAVRSCPSRAALRAPRGRATLPRARGVVCAAKPVETMTLKDGRKVSVYGSTADATTAVADAFVAAYNEARRGRALAISAAAQLRPALTPQRRWCPRRAQSPSPFPRVRQARGERCVRCARAHERSAVLPDIPSPPLPVDAPLAPGGRCREALGLRAAR